MSLFINPYNFIPIGDKPSPCHQEGETYTGYIEYELTTRSSLFIPNTSSDRAFQYDKTYTVKDGEAKPDDPDTDKEHHKLYDFYSLNTLEKGKTYDEQFFEPCIPGSEMRGMIRSVYETLTNSCLSQINENTVIGKRTVEHFRPAVLKRSDEGYVLYEAKDCVYRNRKDFSKKYYMSSCCSIPDGSKVSFIPDTRNKKSFEKPDVTNLRIFDGKNTTGYLIKGESGPEIKLKDGSRDYKAEKHCVHVFVENKKEIQCDKKDVERLRLVVMQYQESAGDANSKPYGEYKSKLEDFCANRNNVDGIPVYYSMLPNGSLFLSPACITREVYTQNVSAAVGGYAPCSAKMRKANKAGNQEKALDICPACMLFGYISDASSRGSKLRFTELTLKDADKYGGNFASCYDKGLYVMPELSTPKLANTEFYLQKPSDPEGDVWFWTYDYYTVKKPDGTVIVKNYTPNISGRKFYYHGCKLESAEHKTCRNSTVRTVKEGITFEGRLYFDNITLLQLQQLYFVLNYTADGKHGFKIGSGKPVGLGSVCIKARKVVTREFTVGEYKTKSIVLQELGKTWEELMLAPAVKYGFDKITKFLSKEEAKMVHYPGVNKEGDEGFAWFVDNKMNHKLASFKPDENKISEGRDKSPRARIQTEILQWLEPLADSDSPVGVIRNYNSEKGFGWIVFNQKRVFFHKNEVKQSCRDRIGDGIEVEFDLGKNDKGDCAKNIRIKNRLVQ